MLHLLLYLLLHLFVNIRHGPKDWCSRNSAIHMACGQRYCLIYSETIETQYFSSTRLRLPGLTLVSSALADGQDGSDEISSHSCDAEHEENGGWLGADVLQILLFQS